MDSWNCPWTSPGALWHIHACMHTCVHVYTHANTSYTQRWKKNLRMSLIGTNTLEHMRSSTHELRWQSVVLLQLPGLSVFAITRLGQSHGKPNFLRSVLTSFHLNSFPASHHWCVHFVLVPRALHCIFHKGLWRMFGDNKERAQPCRAQRSLRLPPGGEDTVPWERSRYLTHAWILCCN